MGYTTSTTRAMSEELFLFRGAWHRGRVEGEMLLILVVITLVTWFFAVCSLAHQRATCVVVFIRPEASPISSWYGMHFTTAAVKGTANPVAVDACREWAGFCGVFGSDDV